MAAWGTPFLVASAFRLPQHRHHRYKLLLSSSEKLFIGIEWQIWINKLGEDNTDENAIQALIVWRL